MGQLVGNVATGPEDCPEREYHGKPFRYCPVKGCGWMEPRRTAFARQMMIDDLLTLGENAKDMFWDQFDMAIAEALSKNEGSVLKGGKVTITVELAP